RQFLPGSTGAGTGSDGQAKATDTNGTATAYTRAGLATALIGRQVLALSGARSGDPRVPDLVGLVQHGVVYTGKQGKIAEHGGADPQDRHVPLVLDDPTRSGGFFVDHPVATTHIAPTILTLLHLDPDRLPPPPLPRTPP